MPPAPAALPVRQRRKEARPQELLDAALRLFVEHGFAATRIEEVAALAGVSKGTLYLYYPSKEELLKAVIRERLVQQIRPSALEVAAATRAATPTCSRKLFEHLVAARLRQPASGVFKLIITEVRNFPEHRRVLFATKSSSRARS